MARKTEFSTKRIAEALKSTGGLVHVAARALGCSPKTIYRRLETVASLRELLHDLREFELDISEQRLRQARNNGEPWAITLHLTTLGKHRGYTKGTEITGSEGEPLSIKIYLPDNQRETE